MFLKKFLPVIFTFLYVTTMAQNNNEYLKEWKKN